MRPFPLAILLTLVAVSCAEFERIDPVLLENAEEITVSELRPPARERLNFGAYLLGFKVGEANFEFERIRDEYTSRLRVEATGLARLLYGGTLDAESVAGSHDVLSRRWTVTSRDGDEVKKTALRFAPETGRIVGVIRDPDEVKKVSVVVKGALDPLASLYALRRADLVDGAAFRTPFFSRESPYRCDTVVKGRERVKVPAGEFDTVLVRVDLQREKDGEPPKEGGRLGIYVTDDAARTPVRIDVDTEYGRISLRLRSYERGWSKVSSGRGTGVRR